MLKINENISSIFCSLSRSFKEDFRYKGIDEREVEVFLLEKSSSELKIKLFLSLLNCIYLSLLFFCCNFKLSIFLLSL